MDEAEIFYMILNNRCQNSTTIFKYWLLIIFISQKLL